MAGTGQVSSSSAGYVTILVATLEALKEEALLKVTENGPLVIEVINHLMKSVCLYLCGQRFSCRFSFQIGRLCTS